MNDYPRPVVRLFTQPDLAWTVWNVGLLVLVTIVLKMILVWFSILTPGYLRATVS
ncbi:hypothetical protein SAMN04490202_5399 [Pseudomonas reinekei]|uniref:Uncharacterized protein n=1 Tax=Pseudomonas reinekei TaxID=395598 RepID=A0A1H0UHD1_PSERE|nr:hypothetical protein [Pseudomonas reinekei]SDP65584.1 hypothetical protein SAMN04490202_5399 [Pseudomonas reinekei]